METFKIYRGKKKIANQVVAEMIGTTVADDLQRHIVYHMYTVHIGKKIAKAMKEDNDTQWELYPGDYVYPLPTYTVKRNK